MEEHKTTLKDRVNKGMGNFTRELSDKYHKWNKSKIEQKKIDSELYKPLYRLYDFAICRLIKEVNDIAYKNKCYNLSLSSLSGNEKCKKPNDNYKKTQELYSKYKCRLGQMFQPTVPTAILETWHGSYEKAKVVFNNALDDILEIYPDFNVDNFFKNLREEFDKKSINKGGFKRKTKRKPKRKSKKKPKRKTRRKNKL